MIKCQMQRHAVTGNRSKLVTLFVAVKVAGAGVASEQRKMRSVSEKGADH
jgi:hypothetical protein